MKPCIKTKPDGATPYYHKHANGVFELIFPIKMGLYSHGRPLWMYGLENNKDYKDIKKEIQWVEDTKDFKAGKCEYVYVKMRASLDDYFIVLSIISERYDTSELENLLTSLGGV